MLLVYKAVAKGNFMPIFSNFIGGPSRGLDAQTIVSLGMSIGVS